MTNDQITNDGPARLKPCAATVFAVAIAATFWFAAAQAPAAEDQPATRPEEILLWPAGAPGAKGDKPNDKPRVIVYHAPAKNRSGAAVVICPGGGYGHLAMGHEGHEVARWLNSVGVTGVILDYRHRGKGYGHPAPLLDAQRAVRLVRSRAKEWKLEADRIGIMGFSAGGHLASSVSTHFDKGDEQAKDPIDRHSSRPDFAILCYPVIAFNEPFTHYGSQRNLLGKDADLKLVEKMSSEKQVTKETPPTFLFHTDEDRAVPPENSVVYYLALRKAKVPAEMHIYRPGRHGLGLATKHELLQSWPSLCEKWLRGRGVIK